MVRVSRKTAGLVAAATLASALPFAAARDLPSTWKSPLGNQGVCNGFYRDDFNSWNLADAGSWNGDPNSASWIEEFGAGSSIHDGVLELPLRRPSGAARGKEAAVTWSRWWQYGEVCASMRIGRGQGVVSSLFTASYVPGHDIDDEMDFEWVGKDVFTVQSNYFSQDLPIYGVNGAFHGTGNSFNDFQTVCIERTADYIKWKINGNEVRSIWASAMGGQFPNRPAKIVFDIWDAGTGTPQGTIDWSGGPTDWNNGGGDYRIQVDWVTINCIGGSAPPAPPPPPPSGGGSSGSGADIGGYCQASTTAWCKSGCCVNAACADYSVCFGGAPSGGGNTGGSGSGAGNGGSCTASTFAQCQSGCCINGACAPYEQCFGGAPPSGGGSTGGSGAANGGTCTASTTAQCQSGCCINAVCSPYEQCFGGAPPTSGSGKADGLTCSASGPECASGCCINAVCSAHAMCFGN